MICIFINKTIEKELNKAKSNNIIKRWDNYIGGVEIEYNNNSIYIYRDKNSLKNEIDKMKRGYNLK